MTQDKAQSMSRVVWKEGAVISIETRRGIFVIAQMIKDPYLVFFNSFREQADWDDIDLDNTDVLFCTGVTRQFLQKSNVVKFKNIKPNCSYEPPKKWLHSEGYSRTIRVWEGTELEKEIVWMGTTYNLVEMDIINHPGGPRKHPSGVFDAMLINDISIKNEEIIDQHERTSLSVFPETNERLYLCYKFGKNVSPEKDIAFGRNLPIEYETYVKIIGGGLSEEEKNKLLQLYIAK